MYHQHRPTVNRFRTGPRPKWIVFHNGDGLKTKLPFKDDKRRNFSAWARVLEIATLGFRADRIGDTIHITGKPSDHWERVQ